MEKLNFDSAWRFHLGDPFGAHWRAPDDTLWREIDLPHDWSIELERLPDAPSKASGGFFQMGRGWYRKTFTVPDDWQGKQVYVEFEGVYMNAEVWLNQDLLGRHPYGYTGFLYDLTPSLKPGEDNVLTVVVDNACQLNSRWYSGSGIYRHVWLRIADPVHVAPWGVYITTPAVSSEAATVVVATTVENTTTETQELVLRSRVSAEGATTTAESVLRVGAGASLVAHQELTMTAPRLWSPESPNLYLLQTELADAGSGTVLDQVATPFGIRSISFDAQNGFLLNGEPVLLRGGCVHHDNGVLGAASYDRAEARKVELHKANGFNAIRCAHNPPAPAFLDACDSLGMLVIDEAFDCWREGKNPYDYHTAFPDWWQRDLDAMVLRDRNHPSVIMWSIGNEIGERNGSSGGVALAQQLADYVRSLDPTRPVTAAINGVKNWQGIDEAWSTTDGVFAALDVGGYNYREVHYRSDHERLPDRVMVGTESTAREALQHWNTVEALPCVIGDFVWTSLDYLGEAGIGRVRFDDTPFAFLGEYPWHQANCGDLDLCGFKRPQSYYRDMFWGEGDPLYIAVHAPLTADPIVTYWGWPLVSADWNWEGRQAKTLAVDVYSRCDRVELFLNGASLGVQPAGPDAAYTATFEVPYYPGKLTAVGYDSEGQEEATLTICTAEAAQGLRLTPDRKGLRAQPGDLSYITVEVVDAHGQRHPKADHDIRFTVTGPGAIAAVGSGNPTSEEAYTADHRRAYQGRCLLVVKATGAPGEIRVRAETEGLAPEEITLTVG